MEPHSKPGGAVLRALSTRFVEGRARTGTTPGPSSNPKYEPKELGPPLLMASTDSTMSSIAAEEACEKVTCMPGSTTTTASDAPVGRLLAKMPFSSR